MNDRIKTLAEQAGLEYNFDPMLWLKHEKFAELIVRDITDAIALLGVSALQDGKVGINSTCNTLVELIKEDYGIIE